MVTELQQSPTVEEDRPRQGTETIEATDALRPGLHEREDFQRAEGGSRNGINSGSGEFELYLEDGCLVFTPLFEKDSQKGAMQKGEHGQHGEQADKEGNEATEEDIEEDPVADGSGTKKGEKAGAQKPETSPQEQIGTKGNENGKASAPPNIPEEIQPNSQPGESAGGWTGWTDGQATGSNEAGSDSAANDSVKPSEQQAPQDSDKIKLDPETQRAKDEFVRVLGDRLQNDSRFRDHPEQVKALADRMAQMDQRILHESPQRADGSFVKPQNQLERKYKALTRIANDAEKLTYQKDGHEYQVYSEPWMVNNILASGIIRGADPEHFYPQGRGLQACAPDAINRGGDEALSGLDTETIADMVTQGWFRSVDNRGVAFTCAVDKESMILNRQAQDIHWDPSTDLDAFGQLGNIRTAQLNLDLMSRESVAQKRGTGGEGSYMYTLRPATGQRDSIEAVVNRDGDPVAYTPCVDARGISNTIEALYGREIPGLGKEMTMMSGKTFNASNITRVNSPEEVQEHMQHLADRGIKFAVIGTNILNYAAEHAGPGNLAWHATSLALNNDGTLRFINNWGGEHDYASLSAKTLFAWMNAPSNAALGDRQLGDHVFDPDGIHVNGSGNPIRDGATGLRNDDVAMRDHGLQSTKENDEKDQLIRAQRKEEELAALQISHVRAQLAVIEGRMASLAEDSPERFMLMKEKQFYQSTSQVAV